MQEQNQTRSVFNSKFPHDLFLESCPHAFAERTVAEILEKKLIFWFFLQKVHSHFKNVDICMVFTHQSGGQIPQVISLFSSYPLALWRDTQPANFLHCLERPRDVIAGTPIKWKDLEILVNWESLIQQ
jgi:hypothetical protein